MNSGNFNKKKHLLITLYVYLRVPSRARRDSSSSWRIEPVTSPQRRLDICIAKHIKPVL